MPAAIAEPDAGIDPGLLAEVEACATSLAYFVCNHGVVQDGDGSWRPFTLWPAQLPVCDLFDEAQLAAVLKARQLGLSWLAVHEVLQTLLFKPGSKCGLFSLREAEAADLLGRVKEVYRRLPDYLKPRGGVVKDSATEWKLGHGSRALAFSTSTGDSYTFDLAVVDEADLVPELDRLVASVKPTIDAGGRMRLISRSNKALPDSGFKRIYRAAKAGTVGWKHVFLPWHARPGRTPEWYEAQKQEALARTGALDYVHEQYPATDEEALAPASLDKRIPAEWLSRCYAEERPIAAAPPGCPAIPGLAVYRLPEPGRRYAVGCDPAEGNPTSDDSSLTVGDAATGEEVATLSGRFEPGTFAGHARAVARWYNDAAILVERNNHGHAVLLELASAPGTKVLRGEDGKAGWLSSAKGKALLYATCAEAFRDGQTVLHSGQTYAQLAAIEGASLRAPQGDHDDRADGYALMLKAAELAAGQKWVPPTPVKVPGRQAWDERRQTSPLVPGGGRPEDGRL